MEEGHPIVGSRGVLFRRLNRAWKSLLLNDKGSDLAPVAQARKRLQHVIAEQGPISRIRIVESLLETDRSEMGPFSRTEYAETFAPEHFEKNTPLLFEIFVVV